MRGSLRIVAEQLLTKPMKAVMPKNIKKTIKPIKTKRPRIQ